MPNEEKRKSCKIDKKRDHRPYGWYYRPHGWYYRPRVYFFPPFLGFVLFVVIMSTIAAADPNVILTLLVIVSIGIPLLVVLFIYVARSNR